MTNASAPRNAFPSTAHLIGQHASLEQWGAPRGQGNIVGTILAVDIAPDGAMMTSATLRADDDGYEYTVRISRVAATQR